MQPLPLNAASPKPLAMTSLLASIHSPADLRAMPRSQLRPV
ncbi:MAG: hypothetical protein JWR60_2150, partial [Polaromonas sp.]|nr:hypothetical protein [Polaromonas sp.]